MATDSVARAIAMAAKAEKAIPGPQGEKGEDGISATIQVGTVTTGEPGTEAEIVNVGTENAAIFNFTIPKGDKGEEGAGGLETIVAGTGTSSEVFNKDDVSTNAAASPYSHAEGFGSVTADIETEGVDNSGSHAEGYYTTAKGGGAHAEGWQTYAEGYGAHAQGYGTKAVGDGAFSGGYSSRTGNIKASNNGAIAYGIAVRSGENQGSIEAKGQGSIAMGVASAGNKLQANKIGSIALGNAVNGMIGSYSSGSIAVGCPTSVIQAKAAGALAGGYGNVSARGQGSIAWGCSAACVNAASDGSVAIGDGVQAESAYQHVRGRTNIADVSNTYADIFGIGNGANGYTLDWSGNATFAGTVTSANGADYAEYFEWKDGNIYSEDRVGYLVSLDGDKIVKAKAGDDILGIISGCATVIGDNAEWNWQGRFERDEFGRIIYDKVEQFIDTPDPDWVFDENKPDEMSAPLIKKSLGYFPVPRENANYDPTKEYENRSNRPEWDTVGMMGKLYVRDDGTAEVNDYVTVSSTTDGIATKADGRTAMRVMERVNDHIIRVCFK